MQPITRSQIKALINLLGQEQGSQAALLRDALSYILKKHPTILQEVIENDFHSEVPAALVRVMHEICWEDLLKTAQQFAQEDHLSLESALAFITRFVNPAFDTREISADLDKLTQELRPLLPTPDDGAAVLETMSRFFFRQKSFAVLPVSHDIKDVSFGRFLQKKQGAALCLCSLYAVCSQRLGLHFDIVDVAGRLLIRYQSPKNPEPLFADPLKNACQLTLTDCKNYISSRNLEWNDSFITPLSSRLILRRFWAQMIFILNKLRDDKQLSYLRKYMDILQEE